MRSAAVAILVAAGCGRISFDRPADSGGIIADNPGDAPRCNSTAPFGAPVRVPSLCTNDQDASARLTSDERTAFVSSLTTTTSLDAFMATRGDRDQPFGPFVSLALNTGNPDYLPTPTADGTELVYESTGLGGSQDIYLTARDGGGGYGPGARMSVSTTSVEAEMFLRADGQVLYFMSDRNGTPDIFRSVRVGNDFVTATEVTELTTTSEERAMIVTRDDLTIYFASNRAGGLDIYEAHRSSVGAQFSAPTPVIELNSSSEDYPSWISDDGCVMYLSSNRPTGTVAAFDIWIATRG